MKDLIPFEGYMLLWGFSVFGMIVLKNYYDATTIIPYMFILGLYYTVTIMLYLIIITQYTEWKKWKEKYT